MPSTLSSLLRYARANKAEATENFTTEALAGCIRADPVPFLLLLERLSVIRAAAEVMEIVVLTQVAYPAAGVLDLVLQLRMLDRTLEIWIEIKVAAGESGHQLDNYRAYIASRPRAVRPELVTLSRWPVRPDPHLLWISWQTVRAQALTSSQPYWADFAIYLEDIHMADEFDAPISAREAAALDDAARLLGKTHRLLWPMLEAGRSKWPDAPWPATEQEVRRNLAVWFRDQGRYTVQMADYKRRGVWMDIGVWPADAESELGIAVVSEPKVLEVRTAMLAVADANGLPPAWGRHIAGWEGLKIRERLVAFRGHDEARSWLMSRLEELSDAGVLAMIGKTVSSAD